jgi:hypothetical protein
LSVTTPLRNQPSVSRQARPVSDDGSTDGPAEPGDRPRDPELGPGGLTRGRNRRNNRELNCRVEGMTQTPEHNVDTSMSEDPMSEDREPTEAEVEAWERENIFLPVEEASREDHPGKSACGTCSGKRRSSAADASTRRPSPSRSPGSLTSATLIQFWCRIRNRDTSSTRRYSTCIARPRLIDSAYRCSVEKPTAVFSLPAAVAAWWMSTARASPTRQGHCRRAVRVRTAHIRRTTGEGTVAKAQKRRQSFPIECATVSGRVK